MVFALVAFAWLLAIDFGAASDAVTLVLLLLVVIGGGAGLDLSMAVVDTGAAGCGSAKVLAEGILAALGTALATVFLGVEVSCVALAAARFLLAPPALRDGGLLEMG